MDSNLRPLNLSEILDRTAQLYRENFLLFAGIAAVYAGVLLVLSLVQVGLQEFLQSHHLIHPLIWATGIGILVLWIATFIFGGLAVAANNRAVAWVHLGQPATIRGAYASILPRLGRYLWLMTITTAVVWLPCIVLYLGYAAFYVSYVRPKGLLSRTGTVADGHAILVLGVTSLVFVVLLLAAFAYAVFMGLRYSLAVPACVVEETKARPAIRRSIHLSKGARGRIFVLGLLALMIQIGLVTVTQAFFVVVSLKHHGLMPFGARVAQQIVAFFTNSFVAPIYATGLTLFYYDQRIRQEGFDIEWMMQAAGMTPPAAMARDETLPAATAMQQPESAHE